MNILSYNGRHGFFHIRGENQEAIELDDYCELIFQSVEPDKVTETGIVNPVTVMCFRWRVKIHCSLIHYNDEGAWFQTLSKACLNQILRHVKPGQVSRFRLVQYQFDGRRYYLPSINRRFSDAV